MSAPARKIVSFKTSETSFSPPASDDGSRDPALNHITFKYEETTQDNRDMANPAGLGGGPMQARISAGQAGQRSWDRPPQASAYVPQPLVPSLAEQVSDRKQGFYPNDQTPASWQHRGYNYGLSTHPVQMHHFQVGAHHQPYTGTFRTEQPLLRHLPPGAVIPQPSFRKNFPLRRYQWTSTDAEDLRRREADQRRWAPHYIREANKDNANARGIFRDPEETSVDGDSEGSPRMDPKRKSSDGKSKARSTGTVQLNDNAQRWLGNVKGLKKTSYDVEQSVSRLDPTSAQEITGKKISGTADNGDLTTVLGLIAHTDLISLLMRMYPRSEDKAVLLDSIEMLEQARTNKVNAWLASAGNEAKVKDRKKRKRASSHNSSPSTSTELPLRKITKRSERFVDSGMPASNEPRNQAPTKSILKQIKAKKPEAIRATQCTAASSSEQCPGTAYTSERNGKGHLNIQVKATPKLWSTRQQRNLTKPWTTRSAGGSHEVIVIEDC